MIIQAQRAVYANMRDDFEEMGTGGGQYSQQQKSYAFKLIDEYGVRATGRILGVPRRTLQRWCRGQSKYVRRCPRWVYSWAATRHKKRATWRWYGFY
jgi:hypothetical protein